ncbi:hypothetical protein AB1N83_010644 [Pleurotus pulmonarius]
MASKPSTKRTVRDTKGSSSSSGGRVATTTKITRSPVIPEPSSESKTPPIPAAVQSKKPTRPATTTTSRPDVSRGTASTTSRANQAGKPTTVSSTGNARRPGNADTVGASAPQSKGVAQSRSKFLGNARGAAATTAVKATVKAPSPVSANSVRTVPSRAAQPERLVSSASKQPQGEDKSALEASDPLQIAAQLYPWMYMTSTLEASMKEAEASVQAAFEAKERELAEQEAEISDQRIRFELERVLALYEELGKPEMLEVLPSILDSFATHGRKCEDLATRATQLATASEIEYLDCLAPVGAYSDLLDEIGSTYNQGTALHSSLSKLASQYSGDCPDSSDTHEAHRDDPRLRVTAAFNAMLAVVQARNANLATAKDLVNVLRQNVRAQVKLASLTMP